MTTDLAPSAPTVRTRPRRVRTCKYRARSAEDIAAMADRPTRTWRLENNLWLERRVAFACPKCPGVMHIRKVWMRTIDGPPVRAIH